MLTRNGVCLRDAAGGTPRVHSCAWLRYARRRVHSLLCVLDPRRKLVLPLAAATGFQQAVALHSALTCDKRDFLLTLRRHELGGCHVHILARSQTRAQAWVCALGGNAAQCTVHGKPAQACDGVGPLCQQRHDGTTEASTCHTRTRTAPVVFADAAIKKRLGSAELCLAGVGTRASA